MNFEAVPLYNKIILRLETPKKVRKVTDKHVLQKQKESVGKIKSGAKKCTVCVSTKEALRKQNNRIKMTEHVYCRSTCLLQNVLRTSRLYGIEADGLKVNENI